MSGSGTSRDEVIAKLIEMGFDDSDITEAVETVGPSFNDAIEYILNGSVRNSKGKSVIWSSRCVTENGKTLGKRTLSSANSLGQMRQASLLDHFQSGNRQKRGKRNVGDDVSVSGSVVSPSIVEEQKESYPGMDCNLKAESDSLAVSCPKEVEIGSDWEVKVNSLLKKHFGYSSLKNFQKEALSAWLAHHDCLVLAATGSGSILGVTDVVYSNCHSTEWSFIQLFWCISLSAGKSLCFQIPALLTGKVVVVISPLISLMHDQCSKLSKHGVTACFLGSGQPDNKVEQKALRGMYSIIYVCPETVIR